MTSVQIQSTRVTLDRAWQTGDTLSLGRPMALTTVGDTGPGNPRGRSIAQVLDPGGRHYTAFVKLTT